MTSAVREALLRFLPDDGTAVPEGHIVDQLCLVQSFDPTIVKAALDGLEAERKIRWVAYRGWSKAGRPGV